MTMKNLRWLALVAAAALAACGGANESTQSATTRSASVLPASDLVASSNQEVSLNKADAVTPSGAEAKRGTNADAFTAVSVDNKAMRKPGANIDLGAPSAADLEQRDKNNKKSIGAFKPRAYQTGFSRPVAATSLTKSLQQLLTWTTTSNGVQRASIRLSSSGAKALRVGLEVQNLPDDAVLRVYTDGSSQAQQTTGAHIKSAIRTNVAADGDSANAHTYWMPATMGEATVLEVDLPAGRDTSGVSLAIPKVIHQVQNAMEAELGQLQAKTDCPAATPDATCTLPPAVNAITTMDFTDGAGSYVCTGTLVANRGTTQQGYVLTANHCISTQTIASSVVSYWFYRSSACNSTSINPGWTSVAGGATLRYNKSEVSTYADRNGQIVVTSDGTDTSLIDLVGAPPAGAMYAGWAFQRHNVNTGTSYVSLHHPTGGWLRRSDGLLTNFFLYIGNDLGDTWPDDKYPMYEVSWTSGITEGGSSGSSLLHDGTTANPKVIGQLWGGTSSCTNTAGKDYYGRFDLAYENGLINWLNPGYRMVFRFYNTGNGAHFFSANADERDAARVNNPALTYESPVYMVAPAAGSGLGPVYRFYNNRLGVHFYTNSETEKANVIANLSSVYTYEGIAWYAPPAGSAISGTVDVYRFYRLGVGTHLYTASAAERDNIIATLGQYYTYEGVAYKAWPLN